MESLQFIMTYLAINTLQGNANWWKGVVVLREVDGSGRFEPEFVSQAKLKDTYG